MATTASIVATGVFASVCPFLFGPMVDLTLTLRRWYVLGLCLAATLIFLVTLIPFEHVAMLTLIVFLSQLAATLIALPVGGLMAHTVDETQKGHAAGWYQAGNLGGCGLGSGAGIWLTDHYSFKIAGAVLAAAMAACVIAPYFVREVRAALGETIRERIRGIGRDFLVMLRPRWRCWSWSSSPRRSAQPRWPGCGRRLRRIGTRRRTPWPWPTAS